MHGYFLGDLGVKVRREDIFKPTTGKESFRGTGNDNRVTAVSIPTFTVLPKLRVLTLKIL
jgi:hypothetical protein